MISELIIYKCKCSKCSHEWNTRSYSIPEVCPKCHRKTWNDDYQVKSAVEVTKQIQAEQEPDEVKDPEKDRPQFDPNFDFGG